MQLSRQFISLVFSSDCSQPDVIPQHSKPFPVFPGEMPYAGSCFPALEKKSNTAVDPRSLLFAGAGGVAAPRGFFTVVCVLRTSAGIRQLPASQVAQMLREPLLESIRRCPPV